MGRFKIRFGNYHPARLPSQRRWTVEERLADLARIADLLEEGYSSPHDRAMFRAHIEALIRARPGIGRGGVA